MNTLQKPRKREERHVTSFLEIVDVGTGERHVLAEFDDLIEAPNWTSDGESLIYNRSGLLYTYEIATGQSTVINSDYADWCNNDHVLSPDNSQIAVSHHTEEDGQSRIYVLPLAGGQPTLITAMAPSYLHGWSPDGRELSYCAERNGVYNIYTIPV
ncbi:TolB family protein [Paenibacillus sp. Soil766]|uniref:TolB family protein n=1 Tax=Paenibacillus sp. Soil766 TaxID=1736404 RepID=UPI001F213ABF|nr:hypothetical protein [Paenibacillus sp. Soil766]